MGNKEIRWVLLELSVTINQCSLLLTMELKVGKSIQKALHTIIALPTFNTTVKDEFMSLEISKSLRYKCEHTQVCSCVFSVCLMLCCAHMVYPVF